MAVAACHSGCNQFRRALQVDQSDARATANQKVAVAALECGAGNNCPATLGPGMVCKGCNCLQPGPPILVRQRGSASHFLRRSPVDETGLRRQKRTRPGPLLRRRWCFCRIQATPITITIMGGLPGLAVSAFGAAELTCVRLRVRRLRPQTKSTGRPVARGPPARRGPSIGRGRGSPAWRCQRPRTPRCGCC